MPIFSSKNYRHAFAELFARERQRRPGWSSAQLAEKTRIQPSYLTNVTKERAHFSSDQIFALAEQLGLSEEETDYLNLLMEWERAEHPARRKKLEARCEQIRQRNLKADKVLTAKKVEQSGEFQERYYLDPNVELLHLYLGTEGAATQVAELAQIWGLAPQHVSDILHFLEKSKLIQRKGKGWKVERVHQLLPRESPLCKPQQMLKRLRALEALQRTAPEKIYSFSGALTMTEETRTQIQARFLVFLQECERLVLASSRKGVYHLQFDLFPWVSGKR